jgi:hypothetical protein
VVRGAQRAIVSHAPRSAPSRGVASAAPAAAAAASTASGRTPDRRVAVPPAPLKPVSSASSSRRLVASQPEGAASPLKDEDRIFTNLYGQRSPFLDGAKARGDWHRTKDLVAKGRDWIIDEMKAVSSRRIALF